MDGTDGIKLTALFRGWTLFLRQFFFHHFAEDVEEQLLRFLNPRRQIFPARSNQSWPRPFVNPPSRPRKQMLSTPLRLASSSARKIFLDLPLVVIAMSTSPFSARPRTWRAKISSALIIVADRGHELAVGREGDGRIRPAVFAKAAEKFRGQMRGIRRTAAVAADQQFFAGSQTIQNQFCRAVQRLFQSRQSAKCRDGLVNRLLQMRHARRLNVGR